ncbi:MAG TPA: hypothetical protein VNC84_06855 [Gammaproteobacteria bacterium]|jgi:hypothetical protein|nr:hypothetical protein [Gammaproteobacteria bacterium]
MLNRTDLKTSDTALAQGTEIRTALENAFENLKHTLTRVIEDNNELESTKNMAIADYQAITNDIAGTYIANIIAHHEAAVHFEKTHQNLESAIQNLTTMSHPEIHPAEKEDDFSAMAQEWQLYQRIYWSIESYRVAATRVDLCEKDLEELEDYIKTNEETDSEKAETLKTKQEMEEVKIKKEAERAEAKDKLITQLKALQTFDETTTHKNSWVQRIVEQKDNTEALPYYLEEQLEQAQSSDDKSSILSKMEAARNKLVAAEQARQARRQPARESLKRFNECKAAYEEAQQALETTSKALQDSNEQLIDIARHSALYSCPGYRGKVAAAVESVLLTTAFFILHPILCTIPSNQVIENILLGIATASRKAGEAIRGEAKRENNVLNQSTHIARETINRVATEREKAEGMTRKVNTALSDAKPKISEAEEHIGMRRQA